MTRTRAALAPAPDADNGRIVPKDGTRGDHADGSGGHRYRGLPPEARSVWQIENLLGGIAFAAVVLLVTRGPFAHESWRAWTFPVVLVAALVTLVEAIAVIPRRHRFYRYAVLPRGVVVVKGNLVLKQVTFPLHQILYVETRRGPVLQHYDLYKVHIGTIAEPHAVGPLPRAAVEEIQLAVRAQTAGR